MRANSAQPVSGKWQPPGGRTPSVAASAPDSALICGSGFVPRLSRHTASPEVGTPFGFQLFASAQFTVPAPPSPVLTAAPAAPASNLRAANTRRPNPGRCREMESWMIMELCYGPSSTR